MAIEFWESLAEHIPEWKAVRELKTISSEVRQGFIHTHGITLQAIGRVGNTLLKQYPKNWKQHLEGISVIDWSRTNTDWEGRAMNGGIFTKAHHNIYLTSSYIKKKMKLKLLPEEKKAEQILRTTSDH